MISLNRKLQKIGRGKTRNISFQDTGMQRALYFLFLQEIRGWHAGSVMDAAGAEPWESCIETARLRR